MSSNSYAGYNEEKTVGLKAVNIKSFMLLLYASGRS